LSHVFHQIEDAIATCRFQSFELQAWVLIFGRDATIAYFHILYLTLIYETCKPLILQALKIVSKIFKGKLFGSG